jgi:1-acyl-sn-glycerol-3-phosphate acyltransferase
MARGGGFPQRHKARPDRGAAPVELGFRRRARRQDITPEGTRAAGARWKTGFWHIARGAGVPIVPFAFDWEHHVIRIMPAIEPADVEPDMRRSRALYAEFHGPHD